MAQQRNAALNAMPPVGDSLILSLAISEKDRANREAYAYTDAEQQLRQAFHSVAKSGGTLKIQLVRE